MRLDREVAIGCLDPVAVSSGMYGLAEPEPPLMPTNVLDEAIRDDEVIISGLPLASVGHGVLDPRRFL
jgi:hypothetical protein